ncbi:MAG: chemoreceptor glutamine deamidase CheD [Rubrivivax sp.]
MATSATPGSTGSPSSAITLSARPALTNSARLQQLRAAHRKPGEASFFYFDNHFRNEAVKVLPGEFFVHDEDILIMTTLGSCIAACIWDRDRRVGGMNHFMLPEGTGDSGRYGSFAMDQLIGELVKRGATRSSMEAKVFGGGAVLGGMNTMNVGQRNTNFVLDYLRTERIPVVSKDVLEIYPRKVCFLPASGKAMVKRLAATHSEAFVDQDRVAQQRTAQPAAGGSIDLF